MDRRDAILKYTTKEQRGIEIGPWFNPIAPKREGYRCLTLDVFDGETLRKRAAADPNIPATSAAMIEDVDLVGSSSNIGELVLAHGAAGTFDYVVSSHNFEHLPNPIRFLQGCAQALKPGGIVSMAVPDHRACFDYFRPVTMLPEWIDAFVRDRERPTLTQDFTHRAFFAYYSNGGRIETSFFRGTDPAKIFGPSNLAVAFSEWMERERTQDIEYHDAHCSVFTPASFELLIRDAAYLGLVPFEILEIVDSDCEFHAHLRVQHDFSARGSPQHEEVRNNLLRKVHDEEASTSAEFQRMKADNAAMRALLDNGSLVAKSELDAAQESIKKQERAVREIRESTSWRITAPLRNIVSIVRRDA